MDFFQVVIVAEYGRRKLAAAVSVSGTQVHDQGNCYGTLTAVVRPHMTFRVSVPWEHAGGAPAAVLHSRSSSRGDNRRRIKALFPAAKQVDATFEVRKSSARRNGKQLSGADLFCGFGRHDKGPQRRKFTRPIFLGPSLR